MIQHINDITVRVSPNFSRHSLMILVDLVQPSALHFLNRDTEFHGHAKDFSKPPFFLRSFGNQDLKYGPAFCPQGLIDCIA